MTGKIYGFLVCYGMPLAVFGVSVWGFFALIDEGLVLGLPLAIAWMSGRFLIEEIVMDLR